MTDFKEILKTPEYEFLKTNPHLGNNIILLGLGGSHAYGTNVAGSDIDIRGIALNAKEEILGAANFEQVVNNETDTTVYSLRKIVSLLTFPIKTPSSRQWKSSNSSIFLSSIPILQITSSGKISDTK